MSRSKFQIAENIVFADVEATKKFYSTQNHISEDCTCGDCIYYLNHFIKQPFEIFNVLSNLGIDLEKNLNSEPTGVWSIVDDENILQHCNQTCQVVGSVNSDFTYKKQELGYNVKASFSKDENDKVLIELNFGKIS